MLWCLGSVLLVAAGAAAHVPQLWLGFLIAVPVLVTSSGLGWRAAAPLVPLALAFVALRRHPAGGPAAGLDLIGMAALLVGGVLAGNDLFSLWHRTARAARDNERRARLLQEAALAMDKAESARALFRAMPRLLADILDFTHAEVFVPDGEGLRFEAACFAELAEDFRLPSDSVTGRAWRTGQPQYVPDTAVEPGYVAGAEVAPTRSELALPLAADGSVRAVLNLERSSVDAFGEADRRTLEAFVRMAEEALGRLETHAELERQRAEQAVVARLTRRLLLVEGARAAAATALSELVPALAVEAGAVAVLRRSRLRTLAVFGPLPDNVRRMLNEGMPLIGLLRTAWLSCEPVFVDDAATDARSGELAERSGVRGVAIVPISNARREVQALLLLADLSEPRAWASRDERLLAIAATSLGVVLDRATLDSQLVAMLDVVSGLARAEEPTELYRRAASSAVRLIPGAEAATILVRGLGGFRYVAAVGYDLGSLRRLGPFSNADELAWYRDGAEAYLRGRPRLVSGEAVHALSASAGGERSTAHAEAARTREIAANLCVPIVDGGDAVAVLNVDSFSDENAFGTSARRLVEAFAQQVAAIVRQGETLDRLQHSVTTDPLTGLGNREGFHRRLEEELGRARRHQHPLSIVMIDVDNFKHVNDRFGHHVGDEALTQVARALAKAGRESDGAYRWGGDEFVVLLPEIGGDEARLAAERYALAVASVEVRGIVLTASVGVACFPEDGRDRAALIRQADDLMYHGKRHQPSPDPPPEDEAHP